MLKSPYVYSVLIIVLKTSHYKECVDILTKVIKNKYKMLITNLYRYAFLCVCVCNCMFNYICNYI